MKEIKSKLRVKELAEVYTNQREINAMLDLVKEYSYDIEKKFLEPACGNGNFLINILQRKIDTINKNYQNKSLSDYEYQICLALTNIYGIDICPDNIKESKDRLLHLIFNQFYLTRNTDFLSKDFEKSLKNILKTNIICANTLEDQNKIFFTEYIPVKEEKAFIKKRFNFTELYNNNPKPLKNNNFKTNYLKL